MRKSQNKHTALHVELHMKGFLYKSNKRPAKAACYKGNTHENEDDIYLLLLLFENGIISIRTEG